MSWEIIFLKLILKMRFNGLSFIPNEIVGKEL